MPGHTRQPFGSQPCSIEPDDLALQSTTHSNLRVVQAAWMQLWKWDTACWPLWWEARWPFPGARPSCLRPPTQDRPLRQQLLERYDIERIVITMVKAGLAGCPPSGLGQACLGMPKLAVHGCLADRQPASCNRPQSGGRYSGHVLCRLWMVMQLQLAGTIELLSAC